jgi:hypothetical protein
VCTDLASRMRKRRGLRRRLHVRSKRKPLQLERLQHARAMSGEASGTGVVQHGQRLSFVLVVSRCIGQRRIVRKSRRNLIAAEWSGDVERNGDANVVPTVDRQSVSSSLLGTVRELLGAGTANGDRVGCVAQRERLSEHRSHARGLFGAGSEIEHEWLSRLLGGIDARLERRRAALGLGRGARWSRGDFASQTRQRKILKRKRNSPEVR